MANKKILIVLFLLMPVISVFSTAGGGLFYGNYKLNKNFSNINVEDYYYYGGFGYGSNSSGKRSGGFGLVIFSENLDESLFKGAFGGVITGKEIIYGPLTISAELWTGFGYRDYGLGYPGVAGLVDFTGQAGIALLPWFQVVIYGGIQGVATFTSMFDTGIYTPVFGTRFIWGSFE